MKRIALSIIALVLALCCATASAETVRLSVEGFDSKTVNYEGRKRSRPVIESYKEAHPDVQLTLSAAISQRTTKRLMQSLQNKQFKFDVFIVDSSIHDPQAILSSGYCADLTDNQEIAALLAQMHPSIAATAQVDGRIYGVPIALNTTKQLYYLDRGWTAAGLTAEDVPTSYTGLLDFLEAWVSRMQGTSPDVCVTADFDSVRPTSYTVWLLGILLRGYVVQCGATGTPLAFDDPAFVAMLERAKSVGEQVYGLYEPGKRYEYGALFTELTDVPQSTPNLVPTRLTDQDPLSISATVSIACVNANRPHSEAAQGFIAHYVSWIHDHTPDAYGILENFNNENDVYTDDDHLAELTKALLFSDAKGPIHSLNVHALAVVPTIIQRYQDYLDGNVENLPASARGAIPKNEEQRRKVESDLELVKSQAFYEERYLAALDFTEEELARYQEITPHLVFLTNTSFDTDSSEVTKLLTRYASGNLAVDGLIKKLNELARQ